MSRANRIAVFLGHPAHYHMFKHMTAELESHGIEVDYLVKRKDMLEDLVRRSGHSYHIVRRQERNAKGKWGLAWSLIRMELNVTGYLLRRKPRLLIGTYAPIISHLTGVPMIVCCEDDTSVIPRFARTSYPYAKAILAPTYCDGGPWDNKMTKYAGFQKLAYLHPTYFTPDRTIIEPHLRNLAKPFVLMRFAKLRAHHDEGIGGITNDIAIHLVDMLEEHYDIYISSERQLCSELEPYRLAINPLEIHHWLSFASIYIGDSQSMAVESAMLGTPSVRFSDFAERIGVLNELENHYQLTTAIPTSQPEKLYSVVGRLAATPNLHDLYQERRKAMLSEQIDVTKFFTDFILNELCSTSR